MKPETTKEKIQKFIVISIFAILLIALGWVMCLSANAQIKVGGEYIGKVYRTQNVTGECEVMHIWGRSTIMPVKEVWINIDDDKEHIGTEFWSPWIDIGTKTDDPILDGKVRKDYHFFGPKGYYDEESDIQIIHEIEEFGEEEGRDIKRILSAIVVMKDKKPQSMVCTCMDYCQFDIHQYRKELEQKKDDIFAERTLENLKTFDEKGFRKIVFAGVFD